MITIEKLMKDIKGIIVGGCNRDAAIILGVDAFTDRVNNADSISEIFDGVKIKDIDIATPLSVKEMTDMFPNDSFVLNEAFGTVVIKTNMGMIECTSFRNDIFNPDEELIEKKIAELTNMNAFGKLPDGSGRHPIVEFVSSFKEDSERRDFRINTIGLGIENDKFVIHDFFNGLGDIENGVIRTVIDADFIICECDQIRAIRGIRFHNRLGFEIEDETKKAIMNVDFKASPKNKKEVAPKRMLDEIEKIFKDDAAKGVKLLDEFGLLEKIIPELMPLKNTRHNPEHHPEGNPFEHTVCALEKFNNPKFIKLIKKFVVKFNVDIDFDTFMFIAKMCVLLHDIGKDKECGGDMKFHSHDRRGVPIAESIMKRFMVSNDLKDAVLFSVENHMKMFVFDEMTTRKKRWICRQDEFVFLLITFIADTSSRLEGDEIIDIDSIMESVNEMMKIRRVLPKLVSGHDAMEFGFKNKEIGTILKEIEIAQVENRITTRDEALDFISKW